MYTEVLLQNFMGMDDLGGCEIDEKMPLKWILYN